jgi:hypothetical protein
MNGDPALNDESHHSQSSSLIVGKLRQQVGESFQSYVNAKKDINIGTRKQDAHAASRAANVDCLCHQAM